MPHVLRDADHREAGRLVTIEGEIDLLPEWRSFRPEAFRRRLVDDDDARRAWTVDIEKVASLTNANPHRLEVARAGDVEAGVEGAGWRGVRPADDVKALRVVGAIERKIGDERRRPHARQRANSSERRVEEPGALFELVEAAGRHPHVDREHVPHIKTGRSCSHGQQRSGEHAGAAEQHERERGFQDDQAAADPWCVDAGRRTAGLAQRVVEIWRRRHERGHDAENDAGGQRHGCRKRQHPHVGARGVESRHRRDFADHRDEHACQPIGDQQAGGAAEESEHQAFDEQLPGQPAPSSPQRRAYGQLAMSRDAAGKEKAGDVRAGDEQHEQRRMPGVTRRSCLF